jgi:hypothetical protein
MGLGDVADVDDERGCHGGGREGPVEQHPVEDVGAELALAAGTWEDLGVRAVHEARVDCDMVRGQDLQQGRYELTGCNVELGVLGDEVPERTLSEVLGAEVNVEGIGCVGNDLLLGGNTPVGVSELRARVYSLERG